VVSPTRRSPGGHTPETIPAAVRPAR